MSISPVAESAPAFGRYSPRGGAFAARRHPRGRAKLFPSCATTIRLLPSRRQGREPMRGAEFGGRRNQTAATTPGPPRTAASPRCPSARRPWRPGTASASPWPTAPAGTSVHAYTRTQFGSDCRMRSGGCADPVPPEAPARDPTAGRGAPRRADGAIRAWRLEVAAAMRSPLARAG